MNQYDMNILFNCNVGSKLKLSSGQYDSVLRHIDLLKTKASLLPSRFGCHATRPPLGEFFEAGFSAKQDFGFLLIRGKRYS